MNEGASYRPIDTTNIFRFRLFLYSNCDFWVDALRIRPIIIRPNLSDTSIFESINPYFPSARMFPRPYH